MSRGQWGLTGGLEEFVHRPGGLVTHVLEHVGVAPERHGGILVTEHLRDPVDRTTGAQGISRDGVSEIVEADVGGSPAAARRACSDRITESRRRTLPRVLGKTQPGSAHACAAMRSTRWRWR